MNESQKLVDDFILSILHDPERRELLLELLKQEKARAHAQQAESGEKQE